MHVLLVLSLPPEEADSYEALMAIAENAQSECTDSSSMDPRYAFLKTSPQAVYRPVPRMSWP